MRKLALVVALSSALFASGPIGEKNPTITNKEAPKSNGVITKKDDQVKHHQNAMFLSPAHIRAMKKATLYKVIVKPLENKSDNTTFVVKDYYTSPFEEYIEYDDLIDRLNKIIDKKIMICQAEHKVIPFDSTVDEINYKNYDDISCLISPLEERLDKGKRKAIRVDVNAIEDSPIQVSEQIVEMSSKELEKAESVKTAAQRAEKKSESKKEGVDDHQPKEAPSATVPPSINKKTVDENGMAEYPEEATKNKDGE
jgi:hypothetical protein